MSSVFVGEFKIFSGKLKNFWKDLGRGARGGGPYTGGRGRSIMRGYAGVGAREARGGGKFCMNVWGGEK